MMGTGVLFQVVSDDLIFILSRFFFMDVCGAEGNRFLGIGRKVCNPRGSAI